MVIIATILNKSATEVEILLIPQHMMNTNRQIDLAFSITVNIN